MRFEDLVVELMKGRICDICLVGLSVIVTSRPEGASPKRISRMHCY